MDEFFAPIPESEQKKQKNKARELRQSSWWKQQLGKGICYHCENKFQPNELTMDHLIPIARGGKSTKNNCVVSCKGCNTAKGHKTRAELAFAELYENSSAKNENQNNDEDES